MGFTVGEQIEGVEFVRLLSASAHGTAYLVRDAITQRMEYLKVIPAAIVQDPEAIERVLREARLHASLKHPNIAQFYAARRVGGELVMTREWVEGDSLAAKLASGPLELGRAADYISQTLLALDYAHAQGVIHRNISSNSIRITENGIVKLTGFELARGVTDPRLTRTGVTLGQPHYMAPEQVKGLSNADHRSDLYAVGVVLFEALTGRRPFEGGTEFEIMLAHVEQPVPPPSRWNSSIPPAMELVVLKALAKEPHKRFQTALEFRDELMRALRNEVDPLDAIETPPAPPKPERAAPSAAPPFQSEPGATLEPPLPSSPASPARVRPGAGPQPSREPAASGAPGAGVSQRTVPIQTAEWESEPDSAISTLVVAVAGFGTGTVLLLAGLWLLGR